MELFVDAAETGMSPRQGTSLASAIKQAAGSFSKQDNRYKALVIFSDGEDLSGGMEDAMRTAQEAGIAVHSIAVGTAQGAAIPIKNEKGEKTGLRTDPEGKTVVSRLNEKTLTAISNATGGRSFRATPSGSEIESLRAFISGVGKNELESKLFREYEDRFQIPLAAAILCIIAALWISEKRGQKRARRGKSELSKAAFLIVIITASASAAFSESIAVKNKRGNMLFAEGKFKDAEKAYLEALVNAPNSKKPEILYNMGNSRLKQGRREEGMQDLRSAAETGDRELQQKCWHNIGNGLFEIGNYKEAAEAYIRSLKLNPQDRDTKHNLEAALMQLSQQKEKEPEKSSGNPNGNPIKNSSFDKDQGMKLLDVMQANELDEQRKAAKRSAERPFEKDW
jgi:tetratricopeptide (TPR) repeat protein